jgi:Ni,Fe-hydrogenase III component G
MIQPEQALESAQDLLAVWTKDAYTPEPGRLDVVLDREQLHAAVAALVHGRWGYLAAITGLDLLSLTPPKKGETVSNEFEVLYHFCEGPAVLTLRVRLPRENPAVPTICDLIPAASPFERELMEMFGITVLGTPDPSRLYLPEDWEEGAYPLRKDWTNA